MRKLILTFSAALFFITFALAQDRTVTGKVTNEKNQALEGVSVLSPDGKYGTQTNSGGNFTLTLPVSVKSLNFSAVNFGMPSKNACLLLLLNKPDKTMMPPAKALNPEATKVEARTRLAKPFDETLPAFADCFPCPAATLATC